MSLVAKALLEGKKVLSLGGNHVRGLDVLGVAKACHELGIEFGIVWVDAHPDANVLEKSEGRHVKGSVAMHGMVSSTIAGQGPREILELLDNAPFLNPKNIVFIGLNAIDNEKNPDGTVKDNTEMQRLINLIGEENCVTMDRLKRTKRHGFVDDDVRKKIDALNERVDRVWVEFDVDVVDKNDMPAEVMDNENGMSGDQVKDLFNYIGTKSDVLGMGVSELDPTKDIDGKSAILAAECIAHTMGISNITYARQMAGIDTRKKSRMPRWLKRTMMAAGTVSTIAAGALIAFFGGGERGKTKQNSAQEVRYDRAGFPEGTGFNPCLGGEWSKHAGARLHFGFSDSMSVFGRNFDAAAAKFRGGATIDEKERLLREILTYIAAAELQAEKDDRRKTDVWTKVQRGVDPDTFRILEQRYGTAARTGQIELHRRWMVICEYL